MIFHQPPATSRWRRKKLSRRFTDLHSGRGAATTVAVTSQEVNILLGFLASYVLRAFTSSAEAGPMMPTCWEWDIPWLVWKTIGKCWFNGIWWDIMGYDGIWHVTWLYELRFKAKDTYSNLTSAILEPGYTHPRRPGTQVAHFIRVAPANTHIAAVLHW